MIQLLRLRRGKLYTIINYFKSYKKLIIFLLGIIVFIILALFTSGRFSSKKVTYMYFNNFKTPSVKIEYYYRGNKIVKQFTTISTSYDSLKGSKKELKKSYKGLSNKYRNLNGVKTSVNFDQSVIYEKIEVNFNKVSSKDLKKYNGPIERGELPSDKPVNLKKSEQQLKKNGFIDSQTYFHSKN